MRSRAAPWFRNPKPQWQCVAALQEFDKLVFLRWANAWSAYMGRPAL